MQMQMQMRSCDLCGHRFPDGRALKGHMRSHQFMQLSPSSSSVAEAEESEGKNKTTVVYGLRENPRKSFRLADPEFSVDAGGSTSLLLLHDGDSEEEEAESSSVVPFPSPDRVCSSASDVTTDEDVARCLVMLSRDAWTRFGVPEGGSDHDRGEPEVRPANNVARRRQPAEGRSRFQCGTCRRVFKSYHALGGHVAGHKKMKTSCDPAAQIRIRIQDRGEGERSINSGTGVECPFCCRVFSSAQALGGHKRSHLYRSPAAAAAEFESRRGVAHADAKRVDGFIDLNLPAQDVELDAKMTI